MPEPCLVPASPVPHQLLGGQEGLNPRQPLRFTRSQLGLRLCLRGEPSLPSSLFNSGPQQARRNRPSSPQPESAQEHLSLPICGTAGSRGDATSWWSFCLGKPRRWEQSMLRIPPALVEGSVGSVWSLAQSFFLGGRNFPCVAPIQRVAARKI